MRKLTFIMVLFIYGAGNISNAQNGHLIDVRITNDSIWKHGDKVDVNMKLNLTYMHIGTQQSVRLQPVIVSKKGQENLTLPIIVVDGKIRNRIHNRQKALGTKEQPKNIETVVRRSNGKEQTVEYAVAIPYEQWMAQSRLVLREKVTGCADCELGMEESVVRNTLLHLFVPRYMTSFATPVFEPVKVRSEVHSAYIKFRQDSYAVSPAYKDNRSQLDSVFQSVAAAKRNPDLTVTHIQVTGYASPEGDFKYNMALSKNRAEAFTRYICERSALDTKIWHVDWKGEDWEGLRTEVLKHPKLLKIDEVLQIINNCNGNRDLCEQELKGLVPPEIYQRLLNEMYPPLRRNEYRIEYNVRSFNVVEAKGLLKQRPNLLSLDEMYEVAATYEQGSPEYDEVMEIAARTYPDKAEALNNAALADLRKGDIGAVIKRLESKASDAATWNTLGVAYAKSGRYDEAAQALQQAIDAGSVEARSNQEQLARVVADL